MNYFIIMFLFSVLYFYYFGLFSAYTMYIYFLFPYFEEIILNHGFYGSVLSFSCKFDEKITVWCPFNVFFLFFLLEFLLMKWKTTTKRFYTKTLQSKNKKRCECFTRKSYILPKQDSDRIPNSITTLCAKRYLSA